MDEDAEVIDGKLCDVPFSSDVHIGTSHVLFSEVIIATGNDHFEA